MLRNEDILQLRARYGHVYCTEILDATYVWRCLTKFEYQGILNLEGEEEDMEDIICQTCVLYPRHLDYENGLGGIPSVLAEHILDASGFLDDSAEHILSDYRAEMQSIEVQMETIIKEAFPSLTLEEIAGWDVPKTLYYYSRAEWILEVLRGLPVGEILKQLNEASDGIIQGSKEDFPELRK